MHNKSQQTKHEISPGIHLRVVPSTPYILEGVENRLYVLLEIIAEDKEFQLERTPYNLAMVLDRSGSMSGEKIKYAKEAAKLILDNIHSQDLLHLVIYDDIIERIFINGKRDQIQQLKRKIDQITARNMTNLSGGLLEGQIILSENTDNSLSKRIFLFSDGLANVGVTGEKEIFNLTKSMHDQGINTTSFGIGQDFNELMMTGIAEYGHGDYFFIENADSIPHIVEEAIQGLLQTIATNLVLRLRGLDGSVVTKIFLHDALKGAILGDLRGGETRRIVAELKVDPSKIKNGEYLTLEVEYRLSENLTQMVRHQDKLKINLTSDETKLVENEEVMTFKVQAEVAEKEQEIYQFLENRQFDQAQDLNSQMLGMLQSTSFRDQDGLILDKLENLEDMTKYIQDAKKRNDARSAMKKSSYSMYMTKSSRARSYKEKFRDDE